MVSHSHQLKIRISKFCWEFGRGINTTTLHLWIELYYQSILHFPLSLSLSLSRSFFHGHLRISDPFLSDSYFPLLVFGHSVPEDASLQWSLCIAVAIAISDCRIYTEKGLRDSVSEWTEKETGDVFAGFLRCLCRRWKPQLWSHSHGRHSSRSHQVQYAGAYCLL